jgi:hypothetical protein
MRLLVRNQSIRYSPIVAFVLALAMLSLIGPRTLDRGLSDAAWAEQAAVHRLRLAVEPTLFFGGIIVSRNRHIIAGAVMGCGAGAALGGGAAALFGVATGGAGLAAVPPAAGIGCIIGAAGGIAIGYPLDTWALSME